MLQRSPNDNWRVTSCSGSQQRGHGIAQDLVPWLDVDAAGMTSVVGEPTLTPHQFPRGMSLGAFLHSLFEDLDFTQPAGSNWTQEKLELGSFESQWEPALIEWITVVLQAPLNEAGVNLNQLSDRDKQVEVEFYLSISEPFIVSQLSALIRQFDLLSAGCPPLGFMQVCGILEGFIDLVFRHKERYYLLNYKSNWLGEDSSVYTQQAMAAATQTYRHDLQYQLHTLALHRYLRHCTADYDYERRFDGIIYLFPRGVDKEHPQQETYIIRPNAGLIALAGEMFAGMTLEET